jgi:hypothetical protein
MAIFDTTGLEVSNGDRSDEADINDLIVRLETSFNTTIETRLSAVEEGQSTSIDWAVEEVGVLITDNSSGSTITGYSAYAWSQESKNFASKDQGVLVVGADGVATLLYSAKAYTEEAKAWAQGVGGVDTEADGVTTITTSAREYSLLTAADAASTAADVVQTQADIAQTAANVVLTNADVVTTGNNVTDAQAAQAGAEVAEVQAEKWAEEAEDVEVEPGKYSALHWAAKASEVSLESVLRTSATGQAEIPAGTTAQRDTPAEGHLRFNTDTPGFEGYVDGEWGSIGGGGGGLDWSSSAQSTDFTAEDAKGYPVDTSGGAVEVQLPVGTAGMTVAIKDYAQTFGTFHCLLVPDGTEKIEGVNDSLKVDTRGAYVTLVYTDATKGWLAVSASAQNPVITKPFMHVQDRKAQGTNGGTSVAGDNDRDLNAVVVNEISGASLASNEVTLPAGTYYMEASAPIQGRYGRSISIRKSDDTELLRSAVTRDQDSVNRVMDKPIVSGRVVLTEQTVIKVTNWIQEGLATFGLGINQPADPEIYTELKVWQEDAVVEAPIVHQPVNQPVVGAEVTGGIFGGELVYSGVADVDVNPLSCMDDTLTQAIAVTGTTNVVISSPTINTIYNFFAVRYNDDTYGVEYDTDVNGANLVATVTHKRWIGFVLTDSSGDIVEFRMSGSYITFDKTITIGGAFGSSFTGYSVEAFVPVSRCHRIGVGAQSTSSVNLSLSLNGIDTFTSKIPPTNIKSHLDVVVAQSTYHFKTNINTATPSIHQVELKR